MPTGAIATEKLDHRHACLLPGLRLPQKPTIKLSIVEEYVRVRADKLFVGGAFKKCKASTSFSRTVQHLGLHGDVSAAFDSLSAHEPYHQTVDVNKLNRLNFHSPRSSATAAPPDTEHNKTTALKKWKPGSTQCTSYTSTTSKSSDTESSEVTPRGYDPRSTYGTSYTLQ